VVTIPADPWPLELAVFNSTARQRILGALLRLGTTDVASVAAMTGMSRSMVLRHLDALERLGVVVGSPPRPARLGRAVSYTIDRARYAACLTTWDLWMMTPAAGARKRS
jgi:DNA-binding MarR family transcriptional regulator